MAALMVALATTAVAQTLSVRDASAAPNAVATVDVVIKNAPAGVAGLNFTLQLPQGNTVALFDSAAGPLVTMPSGFSTGWAVEENVVSPTELRAVIYNTQNPVAGLGQIDSNGIVIAQVKVTISGTAGPGQTVALSIDNSVTPANPSDQSSIRIRKTAFSDTTGVSIGHSGGPNDMVTVGSPATITALRPADVFVDLSSGSGAAFANGWSLYQIYPIFQLNQAARALDSAAPGLGVKTFFGNSVGEVLFDIAASLWNSPNSIIPKSVVQDPNNLVRVRFQVGTTEVNADNVPRFRLRLNATDDTYAQILEIQSSADDRLVTSGNGRLGPAAGAPKNLDVFLMPPDAVRNDIPSAAYNGYKLSLDAINDVRPENSYVNAPEGSELYLGAVEVKSAAVDLGTATPVANAVWDFTDSQDDPQGWAILPPNDYTGTFPSYLGYAYDPPTPPHWGEFVSTVISSADNGLIHRIPSTAPTNWQQENYGYRNWQSPEFTLTPGQLYCLRVKVASPATDPITGEDLDPVKNPHWRVRVFSTIDFQWNIEYIMTKKKEDTSLAATPEGKEYLVFFEYPAAMNATSKVQIAFEIVNLATHIRDNQDSNPYGAIVLKKAEVLAVSKPAGL